MKFVSYINIIRPFNCLIVVVSTLFGAFWLAEVLNPIIHFLAAISAALIAGGGYVINDVFDIDVDKINRPKRPLPSGIISHLGAKRYGILLFVVGIIISIFMRNLWMILLAFCNSLLLYLYAYRGKKMGFAGNLLVSFVTASTFLYGGLSNNNLQNSFFCFGCALFYTLIRELVKDLEDAEGDRAINAKTIPIVFGQKLTMGLVFLFWLFLTILTIIGFQIYYEIYIFIPVIILVNFYLLINLIILALKVNKKTAGYSEKIMKLDMLIFLILLWIGQ
ncbi:MAG: geranylgeranylglycerol-phosphate geranylgeranyltransferase [Candidatus Cloacimonetes bacterium]|nr:geranylgeranylglycerol-phosphate geranylgeranyltransferase [Candidatus Cloacimonadota bacterium]